MVSFRKNRLLLTRSKDAANPPPRRRWQVRVVFWFTLGFTATFCLTTFVILQSHLLLATTHVVAPSQKACMTAASPQFLEPDQVAEVVSKFVASTGNKVNFGDLLTQLYQEAVSRQRMLLTVQIGGMDGVTYDPMFQALVRENKQSLRYWMPVVIEPLPQNYEKLEATYEKLKQEHDLSCPLLAKYAISYGTNGTTCTFCHVNVSPSAPPKCQNQPDWVKFQLGSLDCEYSRRKFAIYKQCFVQEPVPCGSVSTLLDQKWELDVSSVAVLQVDVEGYEYVLIPGMLQEMMPVVIHFENKVMHSSDRLYNTTRVRDVMQELDKFGYTLYHLGEDTLAVHLPGEATRTN